MNVTLPLDSCWLSEKRERARGETETLPSFKSQQGLGPTRAGATSGSSLRAASGRTSSGNVLPAGKCSTTGGLGWVPAHGRSPRNSVTQTQAKKHRSRQRGVFQRPRQERCKSREGNAHRQPAVEGQDLAPSLHAQNTDRQQPRDGVLRQLHE